MPEDVCPCCEFSRIEEIGKPCFWCRISGCRADCRRNIDVGRLSEPHPGRYRAESGGAPHAYDGDR